MVGLAAPSLFALSFAIFAPTFSAFAPTFSAFAPTNAAFAPTNAAFALRNLFARDRVLARALVCNPGAKLQLFFGMDVDSHGSKQS